MDSLILEKAKKIFPLAVLLFFAIIFSIRYVSGLQFLAGISILALLFLLFEPIYPFCLLVLFFWVPRGFNYLFLKDVFVCAPIAEVASYMFLILYLVMGALKKKNVLDSIFKTPLLAPIFIFISGNLISYLFGQADDKLLAYVLFRQNCLYAMVLYIIAAGITCNIRDARKIIIALIISNLFLAAFLFYSYYFGTNIIESYTPDRLGGEFSLFGKSSIAISCIMAGNQMASMMPLVVALIFLNTKIHHKLFGILVLFVFSLVLVSSGTRGAWFAALVGISPVIILGLRYSRVPILSKVSLFICLIAALMVILSASQWCLQLNEYLGDRFKSLMYISSEASILERAEIWIYGFRTFLQYPLGMGFRAEYPLGAITRYPHSLYTGFLLSSGFLGTLGFFWFIGSWFARMLAAIKNIDMQAQAFFIGTIGSTLAFLTYGIFEHPAYSPTIIIPTMWIIWGVTIGLTRTGRKNI